MDFLRLAVFRAVARHHSFSRAAEELYLSQPAVSKHIQQLEAELGVRLFQRLGKRVELTDAGRILADYAQRVSVLTEEVRRVLEELEGLRRGRVRVGASATPGLYLLPDLLARFQRKYPGVETTLAIASSAAITRQVLSAEVDLGFVSVAAPAAGLQVRPFARDKVALIVPSGHWLIQHPAAWPELFPQETLVVPEVDSGTRQLVEAHLAQLDVKPRRVLELSSCEAVKRAVAAGLGVAFISCYATTLEVAHGVVYRPEIPELCLERDLYILTHKDARPSAAVLAFVSLVSKTPLWMQDLCP
jgi:DNA-binding transcriptional LysR family regulator